MTSLQNYVNSAKTGTPQDTPTPGREEVKNNAGGYVFAVSDTARLERFLILGTEGTYYAKAQDVSQQNVDFVIDFIKRDEAAVLAALRDVSVNGRAYRNGPALVALALLTIHGANKEAVRAAVKEVVRTATHLYEFVNTLDALGGWGRAKRRIVAEWFDRSADQLAYQAVKYRQRNGWTLRDVMRLSHPVGVDKSVGEFVLRGTVTDESPAIVQGFKAAQNAGTVNDLLQVLDTHRNLPWETIPTEFLKDVKVWKALFYNGSLQGQALVRNITRLAKIGAFSDLQFAGDYAAALANEDMIERTRLHPINFLNAAVVYREGQCQRDGHMWASGRNKAWQTNGKVLDALNDGFHLSFKHVKPANKRTLLGVDVSGSMGQLALGLDLSCAQVSAALAMTVARTEPYSEIRGFTTGSTGSRWLRGGAELTDLGITAKSNLADAMRKVQSYNFGGTDCAQPMLWALENKVEIDTFVVITDSETWHGNVKPVDALKKYRQSTGIDARLAVLGVASSGFTIADPRDSGTLDMVGFDSNAPKVLADFSAGRI